MTTGVVYCTPDDLRKYFANLPRFDQKRKLNEGAFVSASFGTDVFALYDSGRIGVLYRDGRDLSAGKKTDSGDISANGDWYYDEIEDVLYMQVDTGETPSDDRLFWDCAPNTYLNILGDACKIGSAKLESELDTRFPRPIPPGENTEEHYDYEVIEISARLAIIHLITTTDPSNVQAEIHRSTLTNETETGLLDRLNAGDIKLSFEQTRSDSGGDQIIPSSVDAATTGYPTDAQGETTVLFQRIHIIIVVGGDFTTGTAQETLTYKTADIQGNQIVGETLIDGQHQDIGCGIKVRFVPGKYTADDTWRTDVAQQPNSTSTMVQSRVTRR